MRTLDCYIPSAAHGSTSLWMAHLRRSQCLVKASSVQSIQVYHAYSPGGSSSNATEMQIRSANARWKMIWVESTLDSRIGGKAWSNVTLLRAAARAERRRSPVHPQPLRRLTRRSLDLRRSAMHRTTSWRPNYRSDSRSGLRVCRLALTKASW